MCSRGFDAETARFFSTYVLTLLQGLGGVIAPLIGVG